MDGVNMTDFGAWWLEGTLCAIPASRLIFPHCFFPAIAITSQWSDCVFCVCRFKQKMCFWRGSLPSLQPARSPKGEDQKSADGTTVGGTAEKA